MSLVPKFLSAVLPLLPLLSTGCIRHHAPPMNEIVNEPNELPSEIPGERVVPGAAGRVRPAFNVVVSNVPGPDETLYFRGARLEAAYPMSIPVHGLALNITCNSYAGSLNFGFIGCRDTVPHLQRLAVYCGEGLAEVEGALGMTSG